MDLEALQKSPAGRLIPITFEPVAGGETVRYWAFVPHPLSSDPVLTPGTYEAATRAAMALARLDQATQQLPNPDLLARLAVRREASATSALEGTYAPFDQVLASDFVEERDLSREQREIANTVRATLHGVQEIGKRPLARRLIGELQLMIVSGTSDDAFDSGDLRQRQVVIGNPGSAIEQSRFVPVPNGELLVEGFSDWEKWLNGPAAIPLVVKVALAHYQFETLHPYNNGNGRVGRLVALLQLIDAGVLHRPVLDLSVALNSDKQEYIDELLRVSKTGSFDTWVCYFAAAIERQAIAGVATATNLVAWRDRARGELLRAGLRGNITHMLVDHLIGYPVIDIGTASRLSGRTYQAAASAVQQLVDLNLLTEFPAPGRKKLYVCPGVLRTLEESSRTS